jgi:surfactin synthase thioesterase subunit
MTTSTGGPSVIRDRPPRDPDGTWFRRFHPPARPRTRLLCFPHAGASASAYFALSAALAGEGPELDVVAVQYPGRQDRRREPLIDDIPTLADRIHHSLSGWTDLPFAFFGHSMGATVAFEVARRLEDARTTILSLFVSGRRSPSRARPERVHLGDDSSMIAEVERLSGADARILRDPEMARILLPPLRSDYRAIERYRCPASARLGCPISVFAGDTDPLTSLEEAAAWRDHTTEQTTLDVFPGGHFFVNTHIDRIATLVHERLTRPDSATSASRAAPARTGAQSATCT